MKDEVLEEGWKRIRFVPPSTYVFFLMSRPATYQNVLQAQVRSREKSGEITKKERKPPIEKRGITTSYAAGDCAMHDVTKKYNIKRTRRHGKTSLVSRI